MQNEQNQSKKNLIDQARLDIEKMKNETVEKNAARPSLKLKDTPVAQVKQTADERSSKGGNEIPGPGKMPKQRGLDR